VAAALEVLTRFVASSLQVGTRSSFEHGLPPTQRAPEPSVLETQPLNFAGPGAAPAPIAAPPSVQPGHPASMAPEFAAPPREPEAVPETHIEELEHEGANFEAAPELPYDSGNRSLHPVHGAPHGAAHEALGADAEIAADFDINRLTPEEQELHRRANRVAKVSMQDIKMLRPEQVRQGREHRDLCIRLKDDIEKAHREYDRRFRPIMDHPVDYFYRWMVEILAEGDAHALGDYPYATSAPKR
jgi:hypothetical protein